MLKQTLSVIILVISRLRQEKSGIGLLRSCLKFLLVVFVVKLKRHLLTIPEESKIVPFHTMKAYGRSIGIAKRVLNLGAGWM